VSIAAALPISQLTEDQAVEELARICDLAPDESDQLAFVHWKQEFSKRAQQLEQHIVHLQKVAGVDALPGPEPETQDAPPHHLQPEPAPGPAGTTERKPVSAKKTPKEKLQRYLDAYNTILAQVHADPKDRDLRGRLSSAKANVKFCCKSLKLTEPTLAAAPPIPDPRPKGGARPGDGVGMPAKPKAAPKMWDGQHAAETSPETVAFVEKHMPELAASPLGRLVAAEVAERTGEKAGPDPYVEPTAEDLRALLPDQPVIHITESHVAGDPRELAEAIRRVVQAGNQNRAAIDRQASTADLDQRDRFAMEPPFFVPGIQPEPTAQDRARDIQRLFWPLCQSIEDLPDREAIRPALDVIHARLQTAYALVDEAVVSEAG
jgi:hypothetical protein